MWKRNKQGIYLQFPERVVPVGSVGIYLNDAKTGKLKSVDLIPNMFLMAGKVSIAAALKETASKGIITYCAVGTSSVAPVPGNTQLGAELTRKLISTRETNSGAANATDFTTFFNTSEANGNIEEFGLFGDDASAVANSGTLYARTLTSRVKSSADTMTVQWTILIG